MKRTIITLVLVVSLSIACFAASAGNWGLSSNVVVTNYANYLSLTNVAGELNSTAYNGFFYHFTKELSLDLGFSLKDLQREDHTKDYFNSVYSRITYNLGEGKVIPRIGFEYINSLISLSDTDLNLTTQSLLVGCEIIVLDNVSVLMDLKVLSRYTLEMRRYSEYATAANLLPVLSLRWYL